MSIPLFNVGLSGFTAAGSGVGTTVTLGHLLTGAGTLAAVSGAGETGRAEQAGADLQAQFEERAAADAIADSKREASNFARDQRFLLARQRALIGASGVQAGTGTPVAIKETTEGEAERGEQEILFGGRRAATRLREQATLTRAGGVIKRQSARGRQLAILTSGAGQLFGA